MAISPPSDLLLDVARAADPAKVREATAKLARLAADPSSANEGFGKALAAAKADRPVAPAPYAASASPVLVPGTAGSLRASAQPKTDTYRKFEAVLLQNFVESMLPKDDETFGDAASAGIYRSMMAEQLANQIANAGGIGIAKAIEKAHPSAAAHKAAASASAVQPASS